MNEHNSLQINFLVSSDPACTNCKSNSTLLTPTSPCFTCKSFFCQKCVKTKNPEKKYLCTNCFIKQNRQASEQDFHITELGQNIQILDYLEELHQTPDQKIEEAIQSFAVSLAESCLSFYKSSKSWLPFVLKASLEAVETICPSARLRKDKMSIKKYISLFKLKSESEFCVFFQGGMTKTSLEISEIAEPRVLFYDNRKKDLNSSLIYFEFLREFVDFLICIEPIEDQVVKILNGLEVFVIYVSLKELNHLSRILNGNILTEISEVAGFQGLGGCSRAVVKEINNEKFLIFLGIFDPSLGGTILISGEEAERISEVIKKLLVGLRNARLEALFLLNLGAQFESISLTDLYSEDIWFKSLKICRKDVYRDTTQKFIKIYRSSDKPLGSWFSSLINSEENCNLCGAPDKHHLINFLSKEKLVELTITEAEPIEDPRFLIKTHCLECQKSLDSKFLPGAIWEYSFHKFLWNFFCLNKVKSFCGHLLFLSTFQFQVFNTQFKFAVKDYLQFSFPFSADFGLEKDFFFMVLKEGLKETKLSCGILFEKLLDYGKELIFFIDSEAADDFDCLQLLAIKSKIESQLEHLSTAKAALQSKLTSNFDTFLDVELFRKSLFIQFSQVLISFKEAKKKLKPAKSVKNKLKLGIKNDEFFVPLFSNFRSGSLALPIGKDCFVPVHCDDVSSMIAYSLSSHNYHEETLIKKENDSDDDLSLSFSSFDRMEIKDKYKKIYAESCSFSIVIFKPQSFTKIRENKEISHNEFLMSLARSAAKTQNSGKSSAVFRQTHDGRFLLKIVEEREVNMFLLAANKYFKYLQRVFDEKLESVLNTCLGVFKVVWKDLNSENGKTHFVMVYFMLGFGLPGPNLVYDLKGTTNSRRKVKEGGPMTKMDLNFLEDFNYLPLTVTQKELDHLKKAIMNDTTFLKSCQVIDYSLLLIMNVKEKKAFVGIIDYFQKYTLDKLLENKFKSVIGTEIPTIVDPASYKDRFCETVTNLYFMANDC